MVRSSLDKIMRKAITTRDLSAAYDRMLELLAESMKQVTQPERQGAETSPNQVVRCSTPPTVGINGATVGAFLHLATQHLDALRSDPLCQTRNPTTEEITQVLTKLLQLSGPPTWDSIPCSDGSPARCPAFVWDGSCVSTMIRALCLAPTEGLHVAWAFILKHLSSPALPIRRRDYECFFHLATPSTEDMTLLSTIRQHARAHDVELDEVDYIRYLRLVWQRAATDPSKWEKEALTITSDLFREIVRSGHILCFSQAMYDVLAGRDAPPILTRRVSQPYSKYVVEKVTLNNTCHPPIGRCPLCDATLQRYPFPEEYRKQLLQNLERLPLKGRSPNVSEQGNEKERLIEQLLNDFQKSAVQMGRIGVVIDGANVGYAGLSAWGARANEEQRREEALAMKKDLGSSPVGGSKRTRHVENEVSDESDLFWRRRPPVPVPARLEQVDAVLRELRQHFPEKRAVVVMHERHLGDAHVQPQYREMVKRWKECGSVLISPSGINDDHCWLYVAILHSNSEGQCPVWAVTNDLMRDHHYALMSQRSFLRWREVSCMKFHILAPGTFAQLVPPPAYSVVPQYDATTRRWHIPVRLEEEDLGTKSSLWHPIHWLCVNLEIE